MSIEGALFLIVKGTTVQKACELTTKTPEELQSLMATFKTMGIISREEALAVGQIYYNTGKPCRKGHIKGRYTSTGMCIECREEYNMKYQQQLKKDRANKKRVVLWMDPEDVQAIEEMATALKAARDYEKYKMNNPKQR